MGASRIAIAVTLLVAFMASYTWILLDFMRAVMPDQNFMQRYLIRMYNFKIILFSAYLISNCIMSRTYKTQFENEVLLTGLFSIIFISVTTLLHLTHVLIMPTQWNMILFNGTSIAFFLIIYFEGRKYDLFKD